MGRHSAADDDKDDEDRIADAGDSGVSTRAVPHRNAPRGAQADVHLLRESAALRARCIAAIVVPFLLFFGVLMVTGHLGAFLLWLWIPTVLAGVLVGVFLDLAHRRAGTSAQH